MMIPVKPVGQIGRRDGRSLHLNASLIHTALGPAPGGEDVCRIEDKFGNQWDAYARELEAFFNPIVHTIPAEKGTYILVVSEDEREIIDRVPVIGWLIRQDEYIEPAIATGIKDVGSKEWAILYPDGSVEIQLYDRWDSEKDYVASLRKNISEPPERDLIG